jgi:hypothetical protein
MYKLLWAGDRETNGHQNRETGETETEINAEREKTEL